MPRTLGIYGAGGHGRVVADAAQLSDWDEIVFYDDCFPARELNAHWQLKGNWASLIDEVRTLDGVIVAIGNNSARLEKGTQLEELGAKIVSIIHPRSTISPFATIAHGCLVAAGAVIGVGAVIGEHSIINTAASVDHDCSLGRAVHIAPGAHIAGTVAIGDRSWVGIGASIIENQKIGNDVMIGAGAAVVNNIADGSKVLGIPAR